VAAAIAAIKKLGWEPIIKASGGGTDANIYAEHGITCAILSTGMSEVHTTHEHIAIADMAACARLLQAVVTTPAGVSAR
jgi:tripeptide aminopeptidase